MKVYEFGENHEKTFAMFQCAAEPEWVFIPSAEAMARDYHVFLFIADGHDELGTTFVSVEKYVSDAAAYLRKKGIYRLDGIYGVSMGGASVIRFLAAEDIPAVKAIIDAGITPYPYPRWICRLISLWDWLTMSLAAKNYNIMKAAMPPERWTPKTSLGKLCATDHCRNAVSEMEWLDEQFEFLRKDHSGTHMPVWNRLRGRMPGWEQIHRTYDRPEGTLPPAKTDYANWMPKEMIIGSAAGTGALLTAGAVTVKKAIKNDSKVGKLCGAVLFAGAVGCGAFSIYSAFARRAFSYDGKRKLSKQIIDGIAEYVTVPDGGTGLDVGCGSGTLTIACAKRNPNAVMVGMDHWGLEYRDFSKAVCERNAESEGVTNVRFEQGDAVKLDYPDGYFDVVTSNYVYHNIAGFSKQDLLSETLRVLKKGGTFAIHDLMSKFRYGDMQQFVRKLKAEGYEQVYLIDTTDKFFKSPQEAKSLMLGGSKLLFGKK